MELDYYYDGEHFVEESRQCPFCGYWEVIMQNITSTTCMCEHCFAVVPVNFWNNRPIEDKLEEEISDLKYEIEQVCKRLNWI